MEETKTIEPAQMTGAIFRAISGVIADVGIVAKDKVNKQQGFKYRSVDDVFNALHPALAKNKVFIVPEILEQTREIVGETRNGAKMTLVICKIRFTFFAEDGSNVTAIIIGEALDTGDKATNKAMAIAYKYACFQVFCIPTEDMIDPDSERPELEHPEANQKAESKGKSSQPKAPKEQKPAAQPPKEQAMVDEAKAELIDAAKINTLTALIEKKGLTMQTILSTYHVKALDNMTVEQFMNAMKRLNMTPDKM